MSQTVKISAGYSDKVSQDYNSSQYSLNLELDVVINNSTTEIESASQRLFSLCKKLVLTQRSVNVDTLLNPGAALGASQKAPAAPQSPSSSTQKPASSKQIRFLLQLLKNAKFSPDETKGILAEFKKESFEALTSHEASQLIDRLNNQGQKKAA